MNKKQKQETGLSFNYTSPSIPVFFRLFAMSRKMRKDFARRGFSGHMLVLRRAVYDAPVVGDMVLIQETGENGWSILATILSRTHVTFPDESDSADGTTVGVSMMMYDAKITEILP